MQRAKRGFRFLSAVAALAVVGVVAGGCGGSKSEPAPANDQKAPATQTQPAKAKASGDLTLYTSESQDQVNEMVQAFEAANPGVKVNVFRSGTGEVTAKLNTEMQANAVKADLIWFADYAYFDSIKDKLLAYDSPEFKNVDTKLKYDGGKFYEVREIFNVIGYNTKAIKTPPTGWKDMTNPAYKGKVGMAGPLYSGAAFSTMGTLVHMPEFGWDFYKSLKANGVHADKGNGGVVDKLSSGEYSLVSVVDFMVRNAKTAGSPVDYVWPAEGSILIPTPLGIMSQTKNPDAAKAFIDFTLSDAGQKLFLKQGYIPVKSGIGNPPNTQDLTKMKMATTDYGWIQQNRDDLQKQYTAIFPQ